MTSAVRASAFALLAAALAVAAFAARLPVPHQAGMQPGPAAERYAGYPIMTARLPRPAGLAPQPAASNITAVGSLNWAGYAIWRKHLTFTAIRATLFVPYAQCARTKHGTLSTHWVGLDGFERGSHSVEQTGISADCSAGGKTRYFAWFEMFPLPETRLSLAIRAGDSITASVTYSPRRAIFRLALTDNTRGGRIAVQRACPKVKIGRSQLRCLRNSAEVISEAPAIRSGKNLTIAPLTDYRAVSFDAVSVTDLAGVSGGPVSPLWQTTKIIELRASGGAVVALPTPTQAATFDTYWSRP